MELIFVYNAKSNGLNPFIDYAHKLISPSTYSCDLCKLTHTNFGEKKSWKNFIKQSNLNIKFYHINEFENEFYRKYQYPIILTKKAQQLEILIDSDEISIIDTIDNLINLIKIQPWYKNKQFSVLSHSFLNQPFN